MGTCPTAHDIEQLVCGHLDPGERTRIEEHISSCDQCRGMYQTRAAILGSPDAQSPRGHEPTISVSDGAVSPATSGEGESAGSRPIESIPGYEILGELHRGGQGCVYKALQTATKRTVALKILRDDALGSQPHEHRFEREVELVASLDHPSIVTVFDSGVVEGRRYFSMEYIHGESLSSFLARAKPDVTDILRLFRQIGDAVGFAHRHGIVHRDLKPSNIQVDARGVPHVLDFGLAKAAGVDWVGGRPVTMTGEFLGTLAYAAPEQLAGDPRLIDVRTDVYALGVMLYEALTGQRPYVPTGNLADIVDAIARLKVPTPSLARAEIDREVDAIVLRAAAKEPERRYESAADFADDIGRYLDGVPILARRDSATYVLRKRGRAQVLHHPIVSLLGAAVFAALVARFVFSPMVNHWTRADAWYERVVTTLFVTVPEGGALAHVRVIGLTDDTDVEGLAEREGLENVSTNTLPSMRRLHGRLMERLAGADVRAVVWDVRFEGEPTPYDGGFVSGVQALEGADVTVGVKAWWLDPEQLPNISPPIAHVVRPGGIAALFGGLDVWRVPLAIQRGGMAPLPSLSMSAVATSRHPGTKFDINLERESNTLEVNYWKPHAELPSVPRYIGTPDRVPLTSFDVAPQDVADFGMRKGDLIAMYMVSMPPDEVLAASTIEYGDVFEWSRGQLERRLGGKVVVVGEMRRQKELVKYPGGRMIRGAYGHAVAIDMLLQGIGHPVALPRTSSRIADKLISAILGVLAALAAGRRTWRRAAILMAAALAYGALGLGLAAKYHYLWNPLVPFCAFLVACELAAWIQKVRGPRTTH